MKPQGEGAKELSTGFILKPYFNASGDKYKFILFITNKLLVLPSIQTFKSY